jgi:hypothetical protein
VQAFEGRLQALARGAGKGIVGKASSANASISFSRSLMGPST